MSTATVLFLYYGTLKTVQFKVYKISKEISCFHIVCHLFNSMCDKTFLCLQSSLFNSFIMVMIVMNALVIGFETVEEYKQAHSNVFKALDEFFLAIYTMEFLMKLYAEPRGYWKSSYNIFDFSILALSYVQVIMDELNVGDKILTPLRLLRGL